MDVEQFVFDFGVTDDSGIEREFRFTVLATQAQAQALWDNLLEVVTAGCVGGGYYRPGELPAQTMGGDDGP